MGFLLLYLPLLPGQVLRQLEEKCFLTTIVKSDSSIKDVSAGVRKMAEHFTDKFVLEAIACYEAVISLADGTKDKAHITPEDNELVGKVHAAKNGVLRGVKEALQASNVLGKATQFLAAASAAIIHQEFGRHSKGFQEFLKINKTFNCNFKRPSAFQRSSERFRNMVNTSRSLQGLHQTFFMSTTAKLIE
jgi:bifunctional ADP-heptose synthase (sugar kinase/adenylyltransferase)